MPEQSSEWQAEFQNLRDSAARLAQLRPDVPEEAPAVIRNIDDPEQLADFLAPNLDIPVAQKQAILEELDLRKRLRAVQTHISAQLEVAQIQQKLQEDVKSQFSDAQRKAYLRSQLKAIQRELGEGDTGADEQVARLRTRLEEAKPPAEVMAQAERELKRLDIIPPASPEYSVIVSYVETIAELPWSKLQRRQSRSRQSAGNSRPRSLRSGKGEAAPDRISRGAQTEPARTRRRFYVSSVRRESERPVWANRSRMRWAGSLCE